MKMTGSASIALRKYLVIAFGILTSTMGSNAQELPLLKIGLIADPQYADVADHNSRHYRASIRKLNNAIDTLNFHQVDFVQNLGDIIDRNWISFDSILPAYDLLDSNIINYHLLGNHDYSIDSTHMPKLLDRLNMPDYYYSYVQGQWRFVVLDATDLAYFSNSLHQHKSAKIDRLYAKTADQENHHLWNSGISKKQRRWLRSELRSAAKRNQDVIVFSHLPVWPLGAAHNLWNDQAIVKIIEKSDNVFAFINGHNHAGDYSLHSGVHYITLCGMVENGANSFAILEIYQDAVRLVGFGAQPSIILK